MGKAAEVRDMNIDYDKCHPAMNMEDKVKMYQGAIRVSGIIIVLLAILLFGMLIFLV